MTLVTPVSLEEHKAKYKSGAWKDYSLTELGGIVAFFVKRAGHRSDQAAKTKDLHDAQNYLNMMQAWIDSAKE